MEEVITSIPRWHLKCLYDVKNMHSELDCLPPHPSCQVVTNSATLSMWLKLWASVTSSKMEDTKSSCHKWSVWIFKELMGVKGFSGWCIINVSCYALTSGRWCCGKFPVPGSLLGPKRPWEDSPSGRLCFNVTSRWRQGCQCQCCIQFHRLQLIGRNGVGHRLLLLLSL